MLKPTINRYAKARRGLEERASSNNRAGSLSRYIAGTTLLAASWMTASSVLAQNAQFLPVVSPVASISSANIDAATMDSLGNIYVADVTNAVIRRIDAVTGAVTIVAGGATKVCTGATDTIGDGCLATQAKLLNPYDVKIYKDDIYIADAGDQYVRVVNAVTGIISIYAGNGTNKTAPVNGAAAAATAIANPQAIAFNAVGDLFVLGVNEVYLSRIDHSTSPVVHPVTVIAGTGVSGATGDGGPALSAELNNPGGLAVDAQGNVYLGTQSGCTVRKITIPPGATTGTINTYAGISGSCSYSGDGGLATSAHLNIPFHIALDAAGDLFIADSKNSRIREVLAPTAGATTGTIITIAGNGTAAEAGDGGPALSASFNLPKGVDLTNAGDLLIADTGNEIIRAIRPTGNYAATAVGSTVMQTDYLQVNSALTVGSFGVPSGATDFSVATPSCAAGTAVAAGTICTVVTTFQPAAAGKRSAPLIFEDSNGNDTSEPLTGVGIAPAASLLPGQMSTIAGTGAPGNVGDTGPAAAALLDGPASIAVDGQGNTFIADTANNEVREVSAAGVITRVAGTGTSGSSGDGGAATAATLNAPSGVAVDGADDVYIADTGNNKIRVVTAATGLISTLAGTGTAGYTGDAGAATAATLNAPKGIAFGSTGVVYVADTGNNVVRSIGLRSNLISTLAGTGTAGFAGDGGQAADALLNAPAAIAVDNNGLVYIADTGNDNVRLVSNGIITTLAGVGSAGFNGDGATGTTELSSPTGLAVDAAADVYVADSGNNRVRRISAGQVVTIAGTTVASFSGDGGNSSLAGLSAPLGISLDGSGNVLITDTSNNAVRKISVANSSLSFPTTNPGATSLVQNISLVNAGNASLVPASVSVPPGFAEKTSGATDCNAGSLTLAPGTACQMSIAFTPSTVGPYEGNVVATDNSQNNAAATQTIAVSGISAYVFTASFALPSSVAAGVNTSVTVSVTNPAGTYMGTLHFSSSDPKAVLPANYTYTAADASSHTFTVQFQTAGVQTLAVTDTVTSTITATSSTTVTGGSPAKLTIVSGNSQSANIGASFAAPLVVEAFDAYGNPSPGANVTFTAPSSGATAAFGGAFSTTVTGSSTGFVTSPVPVADNLTGTFAVQANATGVTTAAQFSLTNTSSVPAALTLTASPNPVLSLPSGSSAAVTITATSTGGFNAPITMSCASSSSAVNCQLSASTVAPGATGTPNSIQMNIVTTGPANASLRKDKTNVLACLMLATFGLGLFRRKTRQILLALVLCVGIGSLSGCGQANSDTKPSAYTVTVTGTSGSLMTTTTITCYVGGVAF